MTVAFRRIELTRSLSAELVTSQSLDNPAIIAAPAPVAIEPPMLADGWLRQCLRMVYPGPLWRLVRPLALRGRHFLQREIEPQLEGLRLQQVQAGETLRRLERLLESGALQSPDGPARGHPPAIGLRRKVHQFHAGSATGDAITNNNVPPMLGAIANTNVVDTNSLTLTFAAVGGTTPPEMPASLSASGGQLATHSRASSNPAT